MLQNCSKSKQFINYTFVVGKERTNLLQLCKICYKSAKLLIIFNEWNFETERWIKIKNF